MNNNVLIAFASKSGATEDTAQQIAETLQSKYALVVDLVNLRRKAHPDFSGYGTIVVASGIRMGKWYKEALQFLEKDFQGKNVALFVSSLYQGGDPETYPTAVERYLDAVSKLHLGVKPFAMEAFGGRMKVLGRITKENRDLTRISAWANSLGEKIATQNGW
jgi:menaquinone-dependent protoporphyrinogen IX oxidase